tara:strand:+ start:247 stop:732 length:486 start_codon:yes stop_codon:yes gene_type:complete
MKILNNKIMKGIMEATKLGLYGAFAYLDVPIEIFTILITFIGFDTFLGALASMRMGKEFNFKILLWGFCLKIGILILPLIVALLAKGLEMDFKFLVVLTIKILTVAEFYSCAGNIYTIKNKKRVNKIDVISMMLISFRKFARKFIQSNLEKIEQAGDCQKK